MKLHTDGKAVRRGRTVTTIVLSNNAPLKVSFRELARGIDIVLALFQRLVAVAVMPATASQEEFLPAAEGESRPHGPPMNPGCRVKVPERLRFLSDLGPTEIVAGARKGGGAPYLAFVFSGIVVLECEAQRNALYLFAASEDWVTLAQTPKLDLIRQKPTGFIGRIVHQGDWRGRVRQRVQGVA
jgi:hypothetical protein